MHLSTRRVCVRTLALAASCHGLERLCRQQISKCWMPEARHTTSCARKASQITSSLERVVEWVYSLSVVRFAWPQVLAYQPRSKTSILRVRHVLMQTCADAKQHPEVDWESQLQHNAHNVLCTHPKRVWGKQQNHSKVSQTYTAMP